MIYCAQIYNVGTDENPSLIKVINKDGNSFELGSFPAGDVKRIKYKTRQGCKIDVFRENGEVRDASLYRDDIGNESENKVMPITYAPIACFENITEAELEKAYKKICKEYSQTNQRKTNEDQTRIY